jgi:hypothetical protein
VSQLDCYIFHSCLRTIYLGYSLFYLKFSVPV